MSDPTNPAIPTAQHLLRQFMCIDLGASTEGLDPETVRSAVQTVAQASEYQIFGVCADNAVQGIKALHAYLEGLGYTARPELAATAGAAIAGPIYIKYNPKLDRCHNDRYIGEHRGVLVSCQSAYEEDVNETFGHLPLDLFG